MRRCGFLAGSFGVLAAQAAAADTGVPVLMYHAVNDTTPRDPVGLDLTLPSAKFERQLQYLGRHRIPTLTAAELVAALEKGGTPRGVVLTFDDGYADAATVVTPLLQRYGARATFFVNSGSVGSRNHVTWAQLREMIRAGMEIGAHGVHHVDLSTLDRAQQMHEAGICIEKIANYAGRRPVSYAYPSGAYDATTLDVMGALGLRSAWTERYGDVHDLRRRYELPRLRISRDGTPAHFAALVAG
ncbi:MAG: polysaccharide deacetylase family protein [Candidatus Eremiobacteraeota bacterium]|nr:polysaccharide deacetylase family protein [Candidatus Eremiobacteraeota bacterium]